MKCEGLLINNVPLLLLFSFGTFSFWSAYLRASGDVIVADGYYETQPLLLTYIKKTLSNVETIVEFQEF